MKSSRSRGYGPGGTALLIEITSDNRNRTVAEIRSLLTKNHGNMAEAGAVSWQFHKKGLLTIEQGQESMKIRCCRWRSMRERRT